MLRKDKMNEVDKYLFYLFELFSFISIDLTPWIYLWRLRVSFLWNHYLKIEIVENIVVKLILKRRFNAVDIGHW